MARDTAGPRPGVLHLIDTLDRGGAERVAVTLANALVQTHYAPHLATTRREGPLAAEVDPGVGRCRLDRRRTLDGAAVARMAAYAREHRIELIHAHGSALFVARLATRLRPTPVVVWHAHYGQLAATPRSGALYWLPTRRIGAVIAVSGELRMWAVQTLGIPAARVSLIENPVAFEHADEPTHDLPGQPGRRVVCLANLRPQKDHPTLLRAMRLVCAQEPDAQLLLVGGVGDPGYAEACRRLAIELGIDKNVSALGERSDVAGILAACDIGVLSSRSEGLPIALLEYGVAGLGVVATTVGACSSVLRNGDAGLLVPPARPEEMASAMIALLRDHSRRRELGERLRDFVLETHSLSAVMPRVLDVYESVLDSSRKRP